MWLPLMMARLLLALLLGTCLICGAATCRKCGPASTSIGSEEIATVSFLQRKILQDQQKVDSAWTDNKDDRREVLDTKTEEKQWEPKAEERRQSINIESTNHEPSWKVEMQEPDQDAKVQREETKTNEEDKSRLMEKVESKIEETKEWAVDPKIQKTEEHAQWEGTVATTQTAEKQVNDKKDDELRYTRLERKQEAWNQNSLNMDEPKWAEKKEEPKWEAKKEEPKWEEKTEQHKWEEKDGERKWEEQKQPKWEEKQQSRWEEKMEQPKREETREQTPKWEEKKEQPRWEEKEHTKWEEKKEQPKWEEKQQSQWEEKKEQPKWEAEREQPKWEEKQQSQWEEKKEQPKWEEKREQPKWEEKQQFQWEEKMDQPKWEEKKQESTLRKEEHKLEVRKEELTVENEQPSRWEVTKEEPRLEMKEGQHKWEASREEELKVGREEESKDGKQGKIEDSRIAETKGGLKGEQKVETRAGEVETKAETKWTPQAEWKQMQSNIEGKKEESQQKNHVEPVDTQAETKESGNTTEQLSEDSMTVPKEKSQGHDRMEIKQAAQEEKLLNSQEVAEEVKAAEMRTREDASGEIFNSDEDYPDFLEELKNFPERFQKTAETVKDHMKDHISGLEKYSTQSKELFNQANQQIEESFTPLIGKEYAPVVAYVVSYGLLLLPLLLVLFFFDKIRAIFSLQKILLFVNIYLSAYFATLLVATFILGHEPMDFFWKHSTSSYIFLQLLQVFGYMVYLLLQTIYLMSTCSAGGVSAKFSAAVQWVVVVAVGFHYYVTVFHRAMARKAPLTSWKVYGLYSVSFVLLCLFARVERGKKQYTLQQDDGKTDKKN